VRVLVVEDDQAIRSGLTDLLTDEGYAALEAANGAEALALLRGAAEVPDVILLDLMMPVMDGAAFREHQRSDPALSAIPVIVLTAVGRAQQQAATALGAAALLPKPLRIGDLLALLGRLAPPAST
jgi:CheY-like chemotaxis protein